jgi:3-phenylpropionate/trans-cinnamate dioxygenase ferredoxin reductase subunit
VRVVVVGASLAGARTVQALRREGCDAHIAVIDAASAVACDRPPLSKAFLADPTAPETPVLTGAEIAELDVDLLLERRATGLDLAGRSVGLADGTTVPYDVLVIATGSAPRIVPGVEFLPGVTTLRTAPDAVAIRSALGAGARVVVVGGGFIGAEIAWAARQLGCPVTLVEPLPAMMIRGLGPELGAVFTRRHAGNGVDLRLGVGVTAVTGTARLDGVVLSDGSTVPADLVVIGVGTVPQTGWLAGSGLTLADGVVCDERLSAAPGVYAAGDVARWYHPRYAETLRVEHWTNAVEHGPVVAANICGRPKAYEALPYVWSDQLGARLQIFGRVGPDDEIRYVFGGPDEARFVATAGKGEELHAVVGFGAIKQLLPYRQQLLNARNATTSGK